jgi:threonine synthase
MGETLSIASRYKHYASIHSQGLDFMSSIQIEIHCPDCGYTEPFTRLLGRCPNCNSSALDAEYRAEGGLGWPASLQGRTNSMWRYRELLPILDDTNIVSMGEGMTPLVRSETLAAMLGLNHLYFKDERQGPTGSFKDRQASLAISTLREWGIPEAVVASTGNVAIAYSAYASRSHLRLTAFTISSVPPEKMREVMIYGTELVKVTGTYDQAKQVAIRYAQQKNLFYDSGVKNIAAKESMKTIAFEIAEQLGDIYGPDEFGRPWRTPHWYFQAVSGGLGPVGIKKAFRELNQFELTTGMPRMGLIQSEGCAPMAQAWQRGEAMAKPILNPTTRIATVATDVPGLAYPILREYIQEYGGFFDAVTDEEAYRALRQVAQLEGISVEPATALAFAGLIKAVREGDIDPDDIVVVNVTGHTFPVEKFLFTDDVMRSVDVRPAAREEIPQEGLLAALEGVDASVARVLIIEDDEGASQLMSRILQAYKVKEVHQAYNGREGIAMIEQVKPDLIVLDLMMPEVDGFGVLDWLKSRKEYRNVPVIVVTAKDLTDAERSRLTGQVNSLLAKGSFMDETILADLMKEKLS